MHLAVVELLHADGQTDRREECSIRHTAGLPTPQLNPLRFNYLSDMLINDYLAFVLTCCVN
jgi:hypothetical protein